MSMTKEQQQALDDALVPREQRLTIGSCNYRLSTSFKPKEPTFQVALDVLSLTPFYLAFLITASMCPRLPGQQFVDPPFEEDILTFVRELGYPGNIKHLSDVKVDILPQPWRTFGTIINKCLSAKVTGIDTLRLSRAQILWGLYHQKTLDYVYLLWEDLVFQIENKGARKNKYMLYLRFTKVIINHFMSQDKSISRRNKYGAILPDYLTTPAMKASEAYKTYHDLATGKVQPKPKYVRRSSSDEDDDDDNADDQAEDDADVQSDDDANKGTNDQDDDDDEQTESDNNGEECVHPKLTTHDDEARPDDEVNKEDSFDPRVQTPSHAESTDDEVNDDDETPNANVIGETMDEEATNEEEAGNELHRDVNVNQASQDTAMTNALQTNVQTTQVIEDSHVIITPVNPEGQQQSSSVSSGFVTNMFNPNPDSGIDSLFNIHPEVTSLVDVLVTTLAEPSFLPPKTLPPPPNPLFTQKALEDNFSEFTQMKPFATTVSSIPNIVDNYLGTKIKDAKIIKDQVKKQFKEQVSKILPKIEKLVNDQLESEVLIRLSNEANTSHVVAANLSELELKKILIDKMEANKSINKSDIQKNLYKALVEAYEDDKNILDTYGDTVTFKRRRDEADDDEEPPAGSDGGSKRRRSEKEHKSTSAPKEKTSKSTGSPKEGTK
ncbi:hypothetical protein Tco_1002766 [Tanacetum coccineum]|uniref:Monodehydroascorbate reductase n=1 Tax=Tanacetum coccineum TaxID=301880 RepID=A0ABQ5F776_9ASTR